MDTEPALPHVEFAFPGTLRDRLLSAIESGAKSATSSLLYEYELQDEPIPEVGSRGVVIDSNGNEAFIIETTHCDVVRLADIPLEHAMAEGEGYTSVSEWRESHMQFWTSPQLRDALGHSFVIDDDTLVVLERFKTIQ